jgi:uncharacterized RDD family membrane protein YckC
MSAQWQLSARPQPAVEYASFGLRVLALIVDGLVAVGFIFLFSLPLGILRATVIDEETLRAAVDWISVPYTLAFMFLYFPLTMRRRGEHNGQTWGKQACGIRVMREDRQPVDAQLAIQREILLKYLVFWVLSVFLLLIPALVNYLRPLWDEHNQALHDKLARTYVVKDPPVLEHPPQEEQTYASGWVPPVPPSPSGPVQW